MKRLFLLMFMAVSLLTSVMAERIGTMKIGGVDCLYDTLIHRHIGPGVTYTQFQFNNMNLGDPFPYKMRMHLITIDMTNPYNRLSTYLTRDKDNSIAYFVPATQEQAVAAEKKAGLKPIASVTGNGFQQSHEAGDPFELYEICNSSVSNGIVRYENDAYKLRYYTDGSKTGNIGVMFMNAKVTSSKGISAQIGQINHYRDHVRNKDKLALFCNGMTKARDTKNDDGLEVILEGGQIRVGSNQLTVVQRNNNCGAELGKGQCAITGVGGTIENFLSSLEPGETVTIDISYIDESANKVLPSDTYSAFKPDCVSQGVAYGISSTRYASPATGVSRDGKTVYLADLEISSFSDAPLRCLEDFLIQVGAWNAFYHDGGPSAEMTVDGKFVTNNSVGDGFNGRYMPEGVMVYSTAPDDKEIATLEIGDFSSLKMTIGEKRNLKVFAFNKYGEMIDEDAATNPNVEISCPSSLGDFSKGVFTAVNTGKDYINISVKGKSVGLKIPVTIVQKSGLTIIPSKVFTGEGRPVQLQAKYSSGSEEIVIDPKKISWSANNIFVVSSCKNGLVIPYVDGTTNITAAYEGMYATIPVTVENLEVEGTTNVDLTNKIGSLSDMNLQMPSVPQSIFIETIPKDNEPIIVTYVTGDKEQEKILENKGAGIATGETITLDFDAADTYPVTVKSVCPATTEIKRLIAVYSNQPYNGIDNLFTDNTSHFEFSRSGESLTLINCSSATDVLISVYSFNGTKLAEKQAYLSEAESCTLDVKLNEPVIVRVQTKNGVQVFKLAGE